MINLEQTYKDVVPQEIQSDNLAHAQVRVLDSIFTHGLKSAQALAREGVKFLKSTDIFDYDHVFGQTLNPQPSESSIRRALYSGPFSIIPVLTERGYENQHYYLTAGLVEPPYQLLEDRAAASAIIILAANDEMPFGYGGPTEVPLSDMEHIILPRKMAETYYSFKGKAPTIPQTVVENVVRKIGVCRPFRLPNYEDALVTRANETGRNIYFTGIRLPATVEDLAHVA